MAFTPSSQKDHSEQKGYSLLYGPIPNPLAVEYCTATSVSCSSMSCAPTTPDNFILEGRLDLPTSSAGLMSVGSLSSWQLSYLTANIHPISPNKNAEISSLSDLLVGQLHVPPGGWQQFLDPSLPYLAANPAIASASGSLVLPTESTANPLLIENTMQIEPLGQMQNGSRGDRVSALDSSQVANGPAKELGSPLASSGCSLKQVNSSLSLGLARNLSNGDLSQQHRTVSVGNVNLSLNAPQIPDKLSAQRVPMTLGSSSPHTSPSKSCTVNANNGSLTVENVGKIVNCHAVANERETPADDWDDRMASRYAGFLSWMSLDETKSLQDVSPPNYSACGQCGTATRLGFIPNKDLTDISQKKWRGLLEDKSKEPGAHTKKMSEVNCKRQRSSEGSKLKEGPKAKVEKSSSENSASSSPKSRKENHRPPEPPKQDYIHVRARRGQATDSHSLAERVRRERISERMKFLQDLVPGCSKVTGKTSMLDEIINYVQSLQSQVELLSMKLTAMNPRLNQLHPVQQVGIHLGLLNGVDVRSSGNSIEAAVNRSMIPPVAVETYTNSCSQTSCVWDGELQNLVQMGLGSGSFSLEQTKVEP